MSNQIQNRILGKILKTLTKILFAFAINTLHPVDAAYLVAVIASWRIVTKQKTEYITIPPLPLTEYFSLSSSEDVKRARLATHAHTNSLTFTKYLYLPNSKKNVWKSFEAITPPFRLLGRETFESRLLLINFLSYTNRWTYIYKLNIHFLTKIVFV